MKKKKIIGLSTGRKNGNSEVLLKTALMAAEKHGVETEIIRASNKNKSTTLLVFGSAYGVTLAGTYAPICTGKCAL